VKAVRIPVTGVIMRQQEDGLFRTGGDKIENIIRQIRAARNDGDVRAIILEVESPGGGITESDEIYAALKAFRNSDTDRRVVVFMRDLAASGGYYISMAGDWLICEPTTVVGSIGVIMQSLNWKGLSEKIGIKDTTIKSGANKDLLNPFSEVAPEQLQLLQGLIDSMYGHFLNIVMEGRAMDEATLKPLADGRIFMAKQALDLKLVDQIGYWEDVVEKTTEMLDEDEIKIVRYEQKQDFWELISQIRSPLQLPSLTESSRPHFMYLWQP
jgi:protease-4